MSHHHHHHEEDDYQTFIHSLKGLDESEIAKSKELYLRNAISDYVAQKKVYSSTVGQASFIRRILFGGFMRQMRAAHEAAIEKARNRISNAMMVWKHDLEHCYNDLQKELERADKL